MKKSFKKLKKYLTLKLKVKAFLKDEITNLNFEFERIQQENVSLKSELQTQTEFVNMKTR